jgi:hypothetical protein
MLWALTTPSPDDLTDLGEIEPLMVLINTIFPETTSPCAGVKLAQSEDIARNIRKRVRIP